MRTFFASLVVFFGAALAGCSGMSAVGTIADTYNGVKGAATGYHSMSMVKDLKTAQPVFKGYNSVLVLAEVAPREKVENLPSAFADNIGYNVQGLARIIRVPVQVCAQLQQCAGRPVVVQFREDAYDRNFVQKITMGSKVRGKLLFSDAASGKIITESRIEAVDNYYALAEIISGSLYASMVKSYPPTTSAEGDRIQKEVEAFQKVKPMYKGMFEKTS